MDLDRSEEQEMLRELVRGVCNSYAPLDTVRALEDDPIGYPTELWKQLGELDLIGLMIPPEYGGSGMTMLEGAVVYEELGRALAPSPHFVSAVMGAGRAAPRRERRAEAGVAAADRVGRRDLLDRVARARQRIRCRGRAGDRASRRRRLRARRHEVARPVRERRAPARRPRTRRSDGRGRPVPRRPGQCRRVTHAADDDRVRHAVRRGASMACGCPRRNRIGDAGSGWDTWHATMLRGFVLLAAQAIGGARHAFDITLQYAKDRHQFDKPLGAFQAISHYLADASTTVEGGTILVYEAAWSDANGRSTSRASRRWRSCSRAARSATSPRWASRCSAGSASPSSPTSSSTSGGRSSCRSRGGTTASSRS